jgi:hypothetical protein
MSMPLWETPEFQQLNAELEGLRAMRRRVTLSERDHRYIGDPLGKLLALAYAEQFPRASTDAGITLPVFCAAIPHQSWPRCMNCSEMEPENGERNIVTPGDDMTPKSGIVKPGQGRGRSQ